MPVSQAHVGTRSHGLFTSIIVIRAAFLSNASRSPIIILWSMTFILLSDGTSQAFHEDFSVSFVTTSGIMPTNSRAPISLSH
jgi:hypothetical protein